MKLLNYTRLALIFSVIFSTQVFAAGIALIVHPSSTLKEASSDEVKRLFLSKTDAIQGVKLKPVIQSTSQSIRIVFDEDALGKSPSKSKAYWSRMVFTAAGMPPPNLESSSAIIEWVSKHPDSVSYIEIESVNDSVKLLKEI